MITVTPTPIDFNQTKYINLFIQNLHFFKNSMSLIVTMYVKQLLIINISNFNINLNLISIYQSIRMFFRTKKFNNKTRKKNVENLKHKKL